MLHSGGKNVQEMEREMSITRIWQMVHRGKTVVWRDGRGGDMNYLEEYHEEKRKTSVTAKSDGNTLRKRGKKRRMP